MNQGQKSNAVRKHNQGLTLSQIARDIGALVDDVEAYLRTRDGYPGLIFCSRGKYPVRGRMQEPRRPPVRAPIKSELLSQDERKRVTLPRVEFLERGDPIDTREDRLRRLGSLPNG